MDIVDTSIQAISQHKGVAKYYVEAPVSKISSAATERNTTAQLH